VRLDVGSAAVIVLGVEERVKVRLALALAEKGRWLQDK
jgi:hypothetical protein